MESVYTILYCGNKQRLFSRLHEHVGARRLLYGNLHLGLFQLLSVHSDTSRHDVSGHNWANTLGSSGDDNVACLERHDLRDVAQESGNGEEEELCRVLLLGFAVDLQPYLDVVRVWDFGLGDDLADGQESVEALGDIPGKTLLLGLLLDIPCCHVDGQSVACELINKMALRKCKSIVTYCQ